MQWHIALAEPNREKLAMAHLARLRYEAQYPLLPIRRKLYGKQTIVYRPMFPGYIFVRPGANRDWYRLETAPGIRVMNSLLSFDGRCATVTEDEMRLVRSTAKELCEQILVPEKEHDFGLGDDVVIKVGPFAQFLATIEWLDDDARSVGLITHLFGQEVKVRAQIDHLTAA
jgi:transcription antitermination factor NusG